MDEHRLTRRSLVVGSIASAAAVAVGIDAASRAGAGTSDDNVVVGRFVRAQGARSGVISVDDRSMQVVLDRQSVVFHGPDGVVGTLVPFLPGEEVVVVGKVSDGTIFADQVQTVYTRVNGNVAATAGGLLLLTPTGMRVRVPPAVVKRDEPSGIHNDAIYSSSIWTNPVTGEATAMDLRKGD